MIRFARRNIKLFFRDRAGVFFSLLAVMITISLYVLFLGNIMLGDALKALPGADSTTTSWLAAGLMTTASLTTSLGAIGVMIDDKIRKAEKDFKSSPIPRRSLTGGYLLSTLVVGVLMTTVTFLLSEIYVIANGGSLLPFLDILKILGLIVLSVLTSTSIVTFIVSFFKSHSAFMAASTVVGTLIGFLTGVYIPVGELPEAVQTVVRAFPLTHAASLFRQVLMEAPMAEMFTDAPSQVIYDFQTEMGVVLKFGSYEVTPLVSVLTLIITAVVFFSLTLINMSRLKRN